MKKYLFYGLFSLLFFPVFVSAAPFSQDLYFGMRNNEGVKILQNFLKGRTLYDGPVTGNFFTRTREAVISFQKEQNITPAAGYFGLKTRGRANTFLREDGVLFDGDSVSLLTAQIKTLQEQLAVLLELQKNSTTTLPLPPPVPPLPVLPTVAFSQNPSVFESAYIGTNGLFGVAFPYRVILDWQVNQADATTSVSCAPSLKIAVTPAKGKAEIYPVSGVSHNCTVMATGAGNGNTVSAAISVAGPKWISVGGYATSSFPDVETSLFKIGEIIFYNGGTSDAVFGELQIQVSDEMDSLENRNHKAYFLIRDGHDATDTLISRTGFTFVNTAPKVGEPYVAPLKLPFDAMLAPGSQKTVSIWVEQLKYVRSGALIITSDVIPTTDSSASLQGGFRLVLTKEPPL